MSALTHPVGPEPEGVYWVRRVLVLAVVMALVVLLSIIVRALGGGGSSAAGSTSVSPTRSAPPSTRPSPSAAPGSAKATSKAPTSKAPTSKAPASKASTSKTSGTKAPATAKPTAPATVANKATSSGPVICTPAETAVRVSGSDLVRIGQTVQLTVALLSTGAKACQFDLATFELKIYSGTDRIWSTRDCATWLPKGPMTLKPGVATRFVVNWPTQRSAAQCQLKANLRPGTYVATAVSAGSPPNQQVMQLR